MEHITAKSEIETAMDVAACDQLPVLNSITHLQATLADALEQSESAEEGLDYLGSDINHNKGNHEYCI